ncbi:RNA polymerase sigma factor [Oligosphaera ethanolica]|uniref:RNA polymerase sigma-70 factor (ECF subfamily) n=1 Tax=Oligosphaera ethanolica TaxID=760260 RepID=A0AAE3VCU7_9BACT|nr:sigma-70 family RNA polymerase sigma factor [Oligosphaera ethanolica]MDQ0288157.1 RNA polymerase sigma-70 factor (ECF subfamily) [Oligosphaera ethanolica]NLE54672.1 sigma-70 family RNA polymerase sigma factor [Lentisphaerota bacterium]
MKIAKGTMSDDSTLIERFKAGDQAAFNQLVERHSGKAYQIAYGILGNREDAEEVAQDVFVRIYRALHNFRGDAEFTTWMYRIATNLAKNKYRWNKSRGSQKNMSIDAPLNGSEDGDERYMDLPDQEMAPDAKSVYEELERTTMKELQKLPELYRQALILRNIKDMSYEDIAQTLNCKLGTIKSRIARGREELRQKLGL